MVKYLKPPTRSYTDFIWTPFQSPGPLQDSTKPSRTTQTMSNHHLHDKSMTLMRLKNYYKCKRQNIWWSTTSEPATSKKICMCIYTHKNEYIIYTKKQDLSPTPSPPKKKRQCPRHSAQSILLPAKLGIKIHLFWSTPTAKLYDCWWYKVGPRADRYKWGEQEPL